MCGVDVRVVCVRVMIPGSNSPFFMLYFYLSGHFSMHFFSEIATTAPRVFLYKYNKLFIKKAFL